MTLLFHFEAFHIIQKSKLLKLVFLYCHYDQCDESNNDTAFVTSRGNISNTFFKYASRFAMYFFFFFIYFRVFLFLFLTHYFDLFLYLSILFFPSLQFPFIHHLDRSREHTYSAIRSEPVHLPCTGPRDGRSLFRNQQVNIPF